MRRLLSTLAALVLLASATGAHELWVVPNLWRAAPGQTVTVLTEVGGRFPDGDSFTTPDRIESVRLIGPGTDAILPAEYRRVGDALAADATLPSTPGTYMALVTVKPRTADKTAEVFNAHLAHQGLDRIRADRERRGETDAPARESYSRYGKTLIRVGAGGDRAAVTRPANAPMEIVPQVDPTTLAEGARLRVRVLFEGAPLRDTLVGAIYATAKSKPDEWPLTARTDASGEVEFTLTPAGPWLIRAVHMVRRPGDAPARPGAPPAEYDTYWASLTFELPSGAR
jgi:uncharacterized GH25 family protein